MRRKKDLTKKLSVEVFSDNLLKITKEGGEYFYEIGKEVTSDLAEAISIMMREIDENSSIWDMEFDKSLVYENISPEKSLFWLTGGYSEWRTLTHYSKPWCDCYLDFQEEFGIIVINILKRSRTFMDIRNGYLNYLNLPTLYDFAISKNLIKI